MRWVMVVKKHFDHNPQKPANLWHFFSLDLGSRAYLVSLNEIMPTCFFLRKINEGAIPACASKEVELLKRNLSRTGLCPVTRQRAVPFVNPFAGKN